MSSTRGPRSDACRGTMTIGDAASKRFPKPALQADDVADMNRLRAEEDEILNSYGWVDQKDGRGHIPIDDAIKMVPRGTAGASGSSKMPKAAQFGSGEETFPAWRGGTRPVARISLTATEGQQKGNSSETQ